MTQNPFSFNYTTLLQTSTYQNKKFDIKNAGFMRPAITFLNIQLSNSRLFYVPGNLVPITKKRSVGMHDIQFAHRNDLWYNPIFDS